VRERIQRLGNGTFALQTTPSVVINPWRIVRPGTPPDLILITHASYHACSRADIAKIRGPHTRVLAPASVEAEGIACEVIRPFQSVTIGGAHIRAIATETDDLYSYLIAIDRYDILYLATSTARPRTVVQRPDALILPLDDVNGGRLRTLPEAAAELAAGMRPRMVFTYHWEPTPTSRQETARFTAELSTQTGAASIEVVQAPIETSSARA
jgi:L-ascorbate metabolism protein UlaG (beta-lactamase superfamily)